MSYSARLMAEPSVPFLRRATGALSRRLDRPELLATVYAGPRRELHEEIAIRAVLSASLAGEAAYVDVGTNRGQVLGEAVRAAPQGRHTAFEPIPELAAQVSGAFPTVDCREMAIGAQVGTAEFCHFKRLDGWSGLRRSPEISDERGEPEYLTVTVSTLDVQMEGIAPRVLKIDVEGAELDVLMGARTILTEARPLVIFEHVARASALYGAAAEAPYDLLVELGYEVLPVTGGPPVTRTQFAQETEIVNWLARPVARS
jgi:FkbM family methyltransferase